jgi:hypothetical protein
MATLRILSSTWAQRDHIKVFSKMMERTEQFAHNLNPGSNDANIGTVWSHGKASHMQNRQ